ncbi:hypothetical protein ACFWOG_02870 [Kitasatospora sp. NPDC058406]|uniref:hypothetical protein n=1 Tax=Kitasatospora sp. NPDC058406 TaxID=3346483 RepID=UPI00365550E7
MHAWDAVRVEDHLAVDEVAVPPGREPPSCLGRVPVQRVFEGHRSRDRTPEGGPETAAVRAQNTRFGTP